MERCGGPDETPARDQRWKQLRFIIEDGWEKEQSLEYSQPSIWRKLKPRKLRQKKERGLIVKERFVNLA